ncbi:MAG: TatD family hydrolase [Bacteroidota bacterium]
MQAPQNNIAFTDSHAHIYAKNFIPDLTDVMEACRQAGVNKIWMPNIDHTSIDAMMEVEQKYPGICIPMMGLHPCYVQKGFEKELYLVESWLDKRSFSAIGECGIDLYWDKTTLEIQQEALKIQIQLARKHNLPLIIHSRNAFKEAADLIEEYGEGEVTGIFHCFSDTAAEAKRAVELGFLLGIGGVVTYKNGGLDKVLPEVGLDKLVLETDCPYLAPVPHRGKRNEPAYIPLIAAKTAEILGVEIAELARVTTANAEALFKPVA